MDRKFRISCRIILILAFICFSFQTAEGAASETENILLPSGLVPELPFQNSEAAETHPAEVLPKSSTGFLAGTPAIVKADEGFRIASFVSGTRDYVFAFNDLPPNWSLPAGRADITGGVLRLNGSGSDWSAAVFEPGYVAGVRNPCFAVDFVNKVAGSLLTLGIEGRTGSGEYRRLTLAEDGRIQTAGAGGWVHDRVPSLEVNTVYTAEFEMSEGKIGLYVYEKGQARPSQPHYVLQDADWSEARFAAWLYGGEADIPEIRIRTSEDLPIDSSSIQTFDAVPYGWQLAAGQAEVIGGELRLTGTGTDWSATAWPANTAAVSRRPHYSIDFVHDTGFDFYIGLEGGAQDGSYRRLAFSEGGFIQEVEGEIWYSARMKEPLILGMEYTADFEFLPDRLELYVYQRGHGRPPEPVYTVYGPDWTDARFRAWLFHGRARIQEISAAVFGHSADKPDAGTSFDSVPAGWHLPEGFADVSGGVLNLTGTAANWEATAYPESYTGTQDALRYSVEFVNKTPGSGLTLGLEGAGPSSGYRRLAISENGSVQIVDAEGWRQGWIAPLETGAVYVADFEYLGDRVEVYIYKKGSGRLFDPAFVLRGPDWAEIRFRAWVYQGQAAIRDLRVKTLFSSVEIGLSGLPKKIVSGSSVTVTADTRPVDMDSYRWYLDGVLLAGESADRITLGPGLSLGEHSLTLEGTLNGVTAVKTETFSVIPALPADWTRTASNDYFASRLFVTCSSGDPHCVHPIRTLKLMNLVSGNIQTLDSYNTLYGYVSDFCDVSPSGTTVVYTSVKASPSTAGYWKTYVRNINNSDQIRTIGEYGVNYRLIRVVWNGNESVTLFFSGGTTRTVAQWT